MKYSVKIFVVITALAGALVGVRGGALAAEKRIALVVGNANYQTKPLETTANDAGLIAQTLQAAGFDVTGARDLDEDALRHAFRDFIDKASAEGPDTVAFVYFAGYGLQLEGENYLLPVGADIRRDADVPSKATRVSDYIRSLAASGLKAGVVVLDAARANPLPLSGAPLASGLALYEPGPHMLLAFNAAPGTIAPQEIGPYGAYAHALSEMIRDGGLTLSDVFDKVRLRVDETTKGAQLPWNSPGFDSSFLFFERSAEAPAPHDRTASVRTRPISELGPRDGYAAAVQRDTMRGYEDFVAVYPSDPSAKRIRAILAIRREAITWRRTRITDTPSAYWSYLRRYPRGPHVADAHRRLAELAAAYDPPPSFEMIDYDVPPPPPEEIVYVDRPVFVFDDPDFGFAPPPPPPVYILPPPPPDYVVLPPPVVIAESYALPVPVFVPIPVWQHPPTYVAPPPPNPIYENIHNQVIVDNVTNNVVVKEPTGQILSSTTLKAAAVGAAAGAIGVALPAYIAKKASLTPQGGASGVNPAASHQTPGAQQQPPPGGGAPQAPIPSGAAPAANLPTPANAQPQPGQGTAPLVGIGGAPGKPAAGQAPSTAPGAAPAANLRTPPNARPLPAGEALPPGAGPSGKPAAGQAPSTAPGFAPAANLRTPPNAQPLPAGGALPPGAGPSGKAATGQAPSTAPGAAPAANLRTPPNAQPLPAGGALPPGAGASSGKAAAGQAPSTAPGTAPAANLRTLPNAQPLPTPEKPQMGQGGQGGSAVGGPAPAGAPVAHPAAPLHTPPTAKLDQRPLSGPGPRAIDRAPAMNPPAQPGGQVPGRARDTAPSLRERAPPPAAVYRPPPPVVHAAPPPAAVYRPPPPVVHAAPPPQAARQAPARERHCAIVNGAQVCK